jgi:peptidoglycan hydrolase CwlO-like protein
MQKIIFILLIGSIMASCGTKDTNTIEGKKAPLAEKNAELAKLQKEVTDLQSELDNSSPKKKKLLFP